MRNIQALQKEFEYQTKVTGKKLSESFIRFQITRSVQRTLLSLFILTVQKLTDLKYLFWLLDQSYKAVREAQLWKGEKRQNTLQVKLQPELVVPEENLLSKCEMGNGVTPPSPSVTSQFSCPSQSQWCAISLGMCLFNHPLFYATLHSRACTNRLFYHFPSLPVTCALAFSSL